jgi:hypothetical protein
MHLDATSLPLSAAVLTTRRGLFGAVCAVTNDNPGMHTALPEKERKKTFEGPPFFFRMRGAYVSSVSGKLSTILKTIYQILQAF